MGGAPPARFKSASLGTFASFDRERCRWRVENGTYDPDCTLDAYGQRRRRAGINVQCNTTALETRAAVVAAYEPATCEYELIVESPELCGP
jgi:hypothetical protein